jgi:hypothetical protein
MQAGAGLSGGLDSASAIAAGTTPEVNAAPSKKNGDEGKDNGPDIGPLAPRTRVLEEARDHKQPNRVENEKSTNTTEDDSDGSHADHPEK